MKISTLIRPLAAAAVMTAASGWAQEASAVDTLTFDRAVAGFYDGKSHPANYYVILSDNPSAVYDSNKGVVTMDGAGHSFIIDLYAPASDTKPIVFPAGRYDEGDGSKEMTYCMEFSAMYEFNAKGEAVHNYDLTGPVDVTIDNTRRYTITATAMVDKTPVTLTYTGTISFDSTDDEVSVYPQLKKDIDVTFHHALGVYDGNLFESNTGEWYIYLCTTPMNEGGGHADNGTKFAIMLFDKLVSSESEARVPAGHYTVGRNFKRQTFYPGFEMDYAGITFPMGSYVQEHCPGQFVDSSYGYSYMTDGTVDIEIDDKGKYTITVQGNTNYGHSLHGVYEGTDIPIKYQPASNASTSISTLDNDVVCDLDQIEVARLQYIGVKGSNNDCHAMVLDIGSPSGKDQALVDNGGQIMRFELLQRLGSPYLLEGTYTVTEEKWNTYFAPFRLVQGYFTGGGDLSGTRYMDFLPDRYLVMDNYAPVVDGTLGVVKNADDTYTLTWDLYDDANFSISGTWTGPVLYTYNPEDVLAGVTDITAGSSAITLVRSGIDTYVLNGLEPHMAAGVTLHSLSGVAMPVSLQGNVLSLRDLNRGVYVLRIGAQSFKLSK